MSEGNGREAVRGSRRDKSRRTRLKIIRAAHEEFVAKGFHGATIAAIANRAGVATQTVYFVFGTKTALISAVVDTAVLGEAEPTAPDETEWWASMHTAATASEALRIFISGVSPLLERAAAISEILRAAALTDEEVRAVHCRHGEMQREGYRQVVDILAAKGSLRQGLTPNSATDVLLTVCGDTTYELLRSERGWSREQVLDWLQVATPLLLLPPAQLAPAGAEWVTTADAGSRCDTARPAGRTGTKAGRRRP